MRKMTTSENGVALIIQSEGCRLKAYKPVPTERYYTIGYGHYGPDVTKDMKITEEQALELLYKDIMQAEQALNAMKVNFRQEQFDALVSWIFNLGVGNFRQSTMRKYIESDRDDLMITDQLIKWVNSDGKPLLGLMRRRMAEANMWHGKVLYGIKNNKLVRL